MDEHDDTAADAPPIRVVVVDDHGVVRAGISRLLEASPGIVVVGEASDGEAAVARVAETTPDVVLMDLSMPVLDGVGATAQIVASHPDAAVLVLTSFADHDDVLRALDAGAAGYILKDAEPDDILGAVRAVASGETPLDPRAARALLHDRRARAQVTLSAREREVLDAVGSGLPNKLIARKLGIAEKTVKAHLTRVYGLIGVTDRTQAALWAQRNPVTRISGSTSSQAPPGR